jgi:hypothetical protein
MIQSPPSAWNAWQFSQTIPQRFNLDFHSIFGVERRTEVEPSVPVEVLQNRYQQMEET